MIYKTSNKLIIALDGPSGVGKGLIGRLLAEELDLKYFQSSILYRVLAYKIKELNLDLDDKQSITILSKNIDIDNIDAKDLEDEFIGSIASKVATIGEVRNNLSKYLEDMVKKNHRLIMEGRDIGTKIIPNADLKIFLIASIEKRAERRYKQLIANNKNVILPEILEQLKKRDLRDTTRKVDPLIPALDAKIIDTSEITPSEIIAKILKFLEK